MIVILGLITGVEVNFKFLKQEILITDVCNNKNSNQPGPSWRQTGLSVPGEAAAQAGKAISVFKSRFRQACRTGKLNLTV
jgi:hypothetical protein